MSFPLPLLVSALVVAALAVGLAARELLHRRRRRGHEARLVATWGQPLRTAREGRPVHARFERDDDDAGLDDETWRDLEMDAVFAWADRTLTALGAQALYAWLRTPDPTLAAGSARRERARGVARDPAVRARLQAELAQIGDHGGWDAVDVLARPPSPPPVSLSVLRALTVGIALAAMAAWLWPSALTLGLLLLSALLNVTVHALATRAIDAPMATFRDLTELIAGAARVHAVRPEEGAPADDLAAWRARSYGRGE